MEPIIQQCNNRNRFDGSKLTAIVVGIVLIAVAVYREPVGVGHYREMFLVIFKFGALILFGILLWSKVNRFAAAFLVLAFITSRWPAKTLSSVEAFHLVVFGLGWYTAFMLLFKGCEQFIGYALCMIATIHTLVVLRGGHLMANPNEDSALLAMCFPSFLLLPKHWKVLVLIPLVGIFKVHSFNGILAAMVVLCVYGIYLMPVIWYGYVYFFAMGVLLYWGEFNSLSATQRLGWWIPALKSFWNHQNGCGLGNWKLLSVYLMEAGKIPGGCIRLHNMWIQGLVEMGISFGGLVMQYVFYVIDMHGPSHLFSRLKKVHIANILGVVAFLVVSNTNSLFQMNIINGMVAIALLARLELEIRSRKELA